MTSARGNGNRKHPLSQRQHIFVNAAVFQLAWLVCVLGGSLVAVITTMAVVLLHLKLVAYPRREFIFLAQCAVIGIVCDLMLINAGVMDTGGPLPPLWLSCLWVLFGTTVGYALRFFHGRPWLSALGGALFAPLSYVGGARLANVALAEPLWSAWLVIALAWAVAFPVLVLLHDHSRRVTTESKETAS